jgi:hypothetical protein
MTASEAPEGPLLAQRAATPRRTKVVPDAAAADRPWSFQRTQSSKVRLDDTSSELERRVKTGGKAKAKALLRFLVTYYCPVAIFMLQSFVIFASMSYFIPHIMCEKQAVTYAVSPCAPLALLPACAGPARHAPFSPAPAALQAASGWQPRALRIEQSSPVLTDPTLAALRGA